MKKTYPTEPFPFQYKVWDKVLNKYVFKTSDPKEAYDTYCAYYHGEYFMERLSYQNDWDRYWTHYEGLVQRYFLHDHFGVEVYWDLFKKYRVRRRWGARFDQEEKLPDVRYKKGNPNKIKRGYHTNNWWDDDYPVYENAFKTYGWYRGIRTTAERRRNIADVDEYGSAIVRGRRRKLPSAWDDERNATCEHLTSWKNHSKRRHQWKPKGEDDES